MEMVTGWFNTLKEHLKSEVPGWEDMFKDPRRVFNADESGFPLCTTTGRVIAPTGAKHVYQVVSNNKQQITVMACMNANGDFMPPLIIYPGQRLRDTGMEGFPEAIYGVSNKGWMDSDLFIHFLQHFIVFVKERSIALPVILFIDGYSTHISLEASNLCSENSIVLYCLLPNATHVLQACDIGLFGPMKAAWNKELKSWSMDNIGQIVNKSIFPSLFKRAWQNVATITNAAHGFTRSGLFPLCSENIDKTKLGPSKILSPNRSNGDSKASPTKECSTDNQSISVSAHQNIADGSFVSVVPQDQNSAANQTLSVPLCPSLTQSGKETSNPSVTPIPTANHTATTSSSPKANPDPLDTQSDTVTVSGTGTVTSSSITTPNATVISSPAASPSAVASPSTSETQIPCATATNPVLGLPPLPNPKLSGYISPAFASLTMPEIKKKEQRNKTLVSKIPKALSGRKALQMLQERKEKKENEERMKQERALERKRKQVERALLKMRKDEERQRKKDEKMAKSALKSALKSKLKRKRKQSVSSDSDTENVKVMYAETDDDDEFCTFSSVCFKCETPCSKTESFVQCALCDRMLHVACSDNLVLQSLTDEERTENDYFCDDCTFD